MIKTDNIQIFVNGYFLWPFTNEYFPESEYLKTAISDEKVRWLANLVTHYRHNMISSWNKCWGFGGNRYRSKWFKDYETEKSIVNERAKRELIRKCYTVFNLAGIEVVHFAELQNTTPETIVLANKFLLGKIEVDESLIIKKKKMSDLKDDSPMPWGKHEGTLMANVPYDYLLWLYRNQKCNAPVKKYIESNLEVLEAEEKRGQK